MRVKEVLTEENLEGPWERAVTFRLWSTILNKPPKAAAIRVMITTWRSAYWAMPVTCMSHLILTTNPSASDLTEPNRQMR